MRILLAMACLSALVACNEVSMLGAASVVTTEKTLVDHAVSYLSGKDCYTVRKDAGRSYCREDEANPPPAVHCFRDLGGVSCYAERDPFGDRRQAVGIEAYEPQRTR
ncbi:MAG: hypothetical protein ACFCUO_01750 [Rhodospirillales bacterium]